jgi:3-hydroxyacyl-[acyl-carrier-protein] dehydratase
MPSIALHIPGDHPAFAGHFPGMPITPGVVLLDRAMHAIAQQLQLDLQTCTINSIKFLNPVLPDTQLTVHYEMTARGNIQFDIKDEQHIDKRIAATGVFHA